MITAQTVRAALAELGEARSVAVADHLRVKSFRERGRVRQILDDLTKGGGVINKGDKNNGTYRLTGKPGRGEVQRKLWKFACHRLQKGYTFTAAEAAGLAMCDRDYAKRYYRWLWGAGYLAIAARGPAGVLLFRVVAGKEGGPAPQWNRREEKRKKVGQASPPAILPEEHRPETCATAPPVTFLPAGGTPALPASPQERLNAALRGFSLMIVEIAGSCDRAVEIIQEMKNTILAVKEIAHGEPTESHRE